MNVHRYIVGTSFSGGRSRSTRREPPTMGKQLVSFITCAASRVHPFCKLQSRTRTTSSSRLKMSRDTLNQSTHLLSVLNTFILLANSFLEEGPGRLNELGSWIT
jgi:hypothetical protein